MTDDKSPDDFEEFLKRKGWQFQRRPPENGIVFFVLSKYHVLNGQSAGNQLEVAFPIPLDYPSTAPYGVHLRPGQAYSGNASALGQEWRFLSRRITGWDPGRRNSRYYVDNVDRWLET